MRYVCVCVCQCRFPSGGSHVAFVTTVNITWMLWALTLKERALIDIRFTIYYNQFLWMGEGALENYFMATTLLYLVIFSHYLNKNYVSIYSPSRCFLLLLSTK